MNWKLMLIGIVLLGCIFLFNACYGTKKSVLFENSVYHWKVYLIKKSHFSTGVYQHFVVYYKGRLLIIPKELTDGKREVSEFTMAAAVDNRSSQFGNVIVTFEGDFVREDGVPYRTFVTLYIRPGRGNELIVINSCNGSQAVITFEP